MERQQIAVTAAVGVIVLILVIWGLWSLGSGAVDTGEQVQQLKQQLEQKNQRIAELEGENQQLSSRVEQLQEAAEQQERQPKVRTLSERVHFRLGSARLTPKARATLKTVASKLREAPDRMIRLHGHTDTWPISTPRYPSNWELSAHRAVNVLHHLVDTHDVRRERITATGHGEYDPLHPNNTPENRSRNRRVEFRLVPAGN